MRDFKHHYTKYEIKYLDDDHHHQHHHHRHSDLALGPTLRAAVVTVGHAAAHLYEAAGEALGLSPPALVDLEGVGQELGLLGK